MKEQVILVDERNNELGFMEKLDAHREGRLHRAISVFIFNENQELLLQKRADHKYHSGSLWTNTCCTHPRPGESTIEASNRRLFEEMGIKADLKLVHQFTYCTPFDNGLTENEYDHVYIGFTNYAPILNPDEASDYKYVNLDDLSLMIKENPGEYTSWFKICFNEVKSIVLKLLNNNS